MEEEMSGSARRMSTRSRKVASRMVAALASHDNRTQAALARLEALENDNAAIETVHVNDDDDDAQLDDDDHDLAFIQKKQSMSMKRKTRQGKAREIARKAPKSFLDLVHEANLESLPPHVPTYLRAAVGPPTSTAPRNFCTVCGFSANYTCVRYPHTSGYIARLLKCTQLALGELEGSLWQNHPVYFGIMLAVWSSFPFRQH